MPTNPSPARADACTVLGPVARLLEKYPLAAQSAQADLKLGTWTFKIGPNHQIRGGDYGLFPSEQLREALREERQAASATPGVIVLPALPTDCPAYFRDSDNTTVLTIGDDVANHDSYTMRHRCPESWKREWWNPAHWDQHLTRRDAQGRRWNCSGGTYVMNDFGDLVEVAA